MSTPVTVLSYKGTPPSAVRKRPAPSFGAQPLGCLQRGAVCPLRHSGPASVPSGLKVTGVVATMVTSKPSSPLTFRKSRPRRHGGRAEALLARRQRTDSPSVVRRPSQEGTIPFVSRPHIALAQVKASCISQRLCAYRPVARP